ncbi:MAG: hypothetical protein R2794_10215 [Chitinophagales bacterium]
MVLLRSYATLAEFFNAAFGTQLRFPVFTFGFFVGMAFLSAAFVLLREMKRKEKQGLLLPQKIKIKVGEPASATELLANAVAGFIIGFKVGGMIWDWSAFNDNPQQYVLSGQGNILFGIAAAGLFAWLKFREKKNNNCRNRKRNG